MRICFVGKYPPIQGGVSARNYWITRWLAERGHHVHVVTNAAEVESAFRIGFLPEDPKFPNLPADEAWLSIVSERGCLRVSQTQPHDAHARHVPDHNPFVTKLASLAIEAIERERLDTVVGTYFEPYAVAAWMAAKLTGRPLIVRHAGSDIARLLRHPQLRPCYEALLRDAAIVCGSGSTVREFAAPVSPRRVSASIRALSSRARSTIRLRHARTSTTCCPSSPRRNRRRMRAPGRRSIPPCRPSDSTESSVRRRGRSIWCQRLAASGPPVAGSNSSPSVEENRVGSRDFSSWSMRAVSSARPACCRSSPIGGFRGFCAL